MDGGEWVKLFTGLDMGAMVAIGVVALVCIRSSHVGQDGALLIPLGLGILWGIVEASARGWGTVAIIAKGALMNGAGVSVVAQLVSRQWDRLTGGTLRSGQQNRPGPEKPWQTAIRAKRKPRAKKKRP